MSVDPESDDSGPADEQHRSQIHWLRSLGDRQALFQIMDADRQQAQGLEAAEALTELGDVRGLDHLIASLKSPSSNIRHQAAQILQRLNHPRGLRALSTHHDASGDLASADISAASRGARREQLYGDLSARNTDDLIALWHENDRNKWSALAFEVMGDILKERLGSLPSRDDEATGLSREDIDEDSNPRIQELWLRADTDALTGIMEGEADAELRLEAAEALADLGDEVALEFLIDALDDPDRNVRDVVAEILDWLDLPRGNEALQAHGLEFETDAGNLMGEGQTVSRASSPTAPADSWVAGKPDPLAGSFPRAASMPAAAPPVWQQQGESPVAALGVVLIGAAGGLLGFLVFRFALDLLGIQGLPADAGGWFRAPSLYYLLAALLAGAIFGSVGARVARSIGQRLGWETGEGDLLPVIGALIEGATSALIVNAMMYSVLAL